MKGLNKLLATVMAIVLLWSPAAVTATAPVESAPVAETRPASPIAEETITAQPLIVEEETALREQSTKYFVLSDGSRRAVMYGEPVHYQKDGEWVDIDNSLVAATLIGGPQTGTAKRNTELTADEARATAQGKAYYVNRQNDFSVQLPQEIHGNAPIIIGYQNHTLRFQFNGIAATGAQVTQPLTPAEQTQRLEAALQTATADNTATKIQNDHLTAVYKNRAAITYPGIKNNTDLHYYVNGQTLKEDIVFHAVPTDTAFSFDFTYSGLTAVLEEDKRVTLRDAEGAVVFVIAAPYMYDAGEGSSADIGVTVEPTATGCRYTLTPSRAWLTDESRVYPVTLDPQVGTTQNTHYIHDNGVQQDDPNTNYIAVNRMYVGSAPNSKQGRIYFKLTQWPSASQLNSDTISSAFLYLSYYPTSSFQTAYQMYIDVYQLSSAWDTNTITWSNQTSIGGALVGSKYISDSRQKTSGYDEFDVLAWAITHYLDPSTDYGIRLQPRTVSSSLNRVCYISSDYYDNTALRPIMYIEYEVELPYTLYFQQYYDAGYAARYPGTPAVDIANYTQVVANYFQVVFGIDIVSTVSTYTSSGDNCSHKSGYDSCCTATLSGSCDYGSGVYHCTNWYNMFYENPSGMGIARNTKVIKWTGHTLCRTYNDTHITVSGGLGSISDGNVLIYSRLSLQNRYMVSVCTIAHEISHTLGCIDYNPNIDSEREDRCTEPNCMMTANVNGLTDEIKLANLESCSVNAFCSSCRAKIMNYANTYLG